LPRHDTDLENTTPSLIGTQWAAPNYRRKAMTEQDDPELWKQTPTRTEYGDTVKIYRDGKLIMELTPEKEKAMSSFTPGPWRVGGNSWFVNQIPIEPAIGCAYGAGYEVKANARLIAAAPDLLEALKEMLAYSGIIEERDSNYTTNKARAAIRKATGE
jgi:hypothetical protein